MNPISVDLWIPVQSILLPLAALIGLTIAGVALAVRIWPARR